MDRPVFPPDTIPDPATAIEQLRDVNQSIDAVRHFTENIHTADGVLHNIPITVKDNITVADMPCTAGSHILENYRPVFDATAVTKVKDAGGFIAAKTNMDEFGFGTFSTNSAFETPKNPWNTDHVTGGSSGGAAALTAASPVPHLALGQSTGGSISAPAAFCGVVGLTPTYGKVSRYGLIDYANSLDKIGSLTQSVPGAALLLDVISGRDENDFTTTKTRGNHVTRLSPDAASKTIGCITELCNPEHLNGLQPTVASTVRDAAAELEACGATVEDVSIPVLNPDVMVAAYYIIAAAEASTNLAKFSGLRYGQQEDPEGNGFNEYFSRIRSTYFGEEAKRRILLGTYARMEGYRDKYYVKALKVRQKIIDAYKHAFSTYDVLVTPAMPLTAPTFDEAADLSPIETYAMDAVTIGPNLAGLPHMSLPIGFVNGLPVGIHLIADHFEEQTLLNTAYELEHALNLDTQVNVS